MRPALPLSILIIACAAACAHQQQPAPEEVVRETPVAPAPPSASPAPAVVASSEPPARCPVLRVHFAFDEALIKSEDLPALDKVARCLRANAAQRIVIEGNADERGTEEYNLMLSAKRAASVERYLEQLGVSRAQMDSVSYGDERPLCNEHQESCWAQNRRVALLPQ